MRNRNIQEAEDKGGYKKTIIMNIIKAAKRTIPLAALFVITMSAKGQEFDYDFSDDKTGVTIYYNVTSDEYPLTIAVANRDFNYNSYKGAITVPAKVFKGGGLYDVTSVWENAFAYSDSLTEVTFPESVTVLEDGAFIGCKKLKKITIPGNLESIGNAAFYGCSSLETITLAASLVQIGDEAFSGCSSLKSIYIQSETPPQISGSSLGKIKAVIYVPRGASEAYMTSDVWEKYKIVETEE